MPTLAETLQATEIIASVEIPHEIAEEIREEIEEAIRGVLTKHDLSHESLMVETDESLFAEQL